MATLTIVEYNTLSVIPGSKERTPLPQEPPETTQNAITLSGSSQASSAFGSATNFIEVTSDADFRFAIAGNPTASANSSLRAAGSHYFAVKPSLKIAVKTA